MQLVRRFYSHFLAAFLVAGALGLLSTQVGHEADYGPAGRLLIEAVAPLQGGVTYAGQSIAGVWNGYIGLIGVNHENRQLKEQVRRLQAQVVAGSEDRLANQRLQKLLDFKTASGLSLTSAHVIAKSADPLFRTVVIDRGTADGISRGMAVVVPEGVVGRVISASRGYAKVLLANDRASAVDAIVQRTRAQGIFVGTGGGMGSLKYVARSDEVRPGDLVISSGLGQVFPKGLPLGVVENVSGERAAVFQSVRVRPTIDFGSLEEVMVVKTLAADRVS
jgi:rod shape-determining protein MreC